MRWTSGEKTNNNPTKDRLYERVVSASFNSLPNIYNIKNLSLSRLRFFYL